MRINLISFVISLVLAAVTFAQPVGPVTVNEGWGHGLARGDNIVFEQVPHPWGELGLGDVHQWGPFNPETDLLSYVHSGTKSPCWPWAWSVVDPSMPELYSYTVQWAPNGELDLLGVWASEVGVGMGNWINNNPTPITWEEHRLGAPIHAVLHWETVNEWILMDGFNHPEWFGWSDPIYSPFVAYYGLYPWDAEIHATVEWLNPLPDVQEQGIVGLGFLWFGGQSRLTIEVHPREQLSDFNFDGVTDVADIFEFLRFWFTGWIRADIDGNGAVEVPDIFTYLTRWFESQ